MPNTRLDNNKNREIGHIVSFFSGVAKVKGLPHVFLHEVISDEKGEEVGIVIGFDQDFVEVLFFDDSLNPEKPIFRSKKIYSVKVSDDCLGRVLNGLGKPLDEMGEIQGKEMPVFNQAPQIIEREPVSTPLFTGIKLIDATLPLGRGQRELIIGDRKLGKSTIAQDIVLNQKEARPPVFCVYALCGQKQKELRELVSLFKKYDAFLYTTVIAATSDSSFAEQYLAPFVATTIGEYFRNQGKDALVVYDDLTKHAKIYRDIALLLERAPGREAYPGDIFSLHAGLLERAGKLSKEKGGGSLSSIPLAETQEGDITSFIPTNLISITDGQIYLERGLFQKRFLPAVNVGLSVSRVGSQAQPNVLKKVISNLRLTLAQHKELQKLLQLETTTAQATKKRIQRGELTLELLKQEKHTNVSLAEQVILFYCLEKGLLDDINPEKWSNFESFFLEFMKTRYFDLIETIQKGVLTNKEEKEIEEGLAKFKKEFFFKI